MDYEAKQTLLSELTAGRAGLDEVGQCIQDDRIDTAYGQLSMIVVSLQGVLAELHNETLSSGKRLC